MCSVGEESELVSGFKNLPLLNNEDTASRFLQPIYAIRLGYWRCCHGTSSGAYLCSYRLLAMIPCSQSYAACSADLRQRGNL
mgnify:CR=1 FL=1